MFDKPTLQKKKETQKNKKWVKTEFFFIEIRSTLKCWIKAEILEFWMLAYKFPVYMKHRTKNTGFNKRVRSCIKWQTTQFVHHFF